MSEVKTKYEVGQKLHTVELISLKHIEFEVERIRIQVKKDSTLIEYCPKDQYSGYDEDKCFPSEAALVNHITGK